MNYFLAYNQKFENIGSWTPDPSINAYFDFKNRERNGFLIIDRIEDTITRINKLLIFGDIQELRKLKEFCEEYKKAGATIIEWNRRQ